MRFRIRHVTVYRYDRPVALGPHLFRLRPRAGEALRLDAFRLFTHPRAAAARVLEDDEGNAVDELLFEGATQEFRVVMECEGETFAVTPFAPDVLRAPEPAPLAPDYTGIVVSPVDPDRLAAWLRRPEGEDNVAAFSGAVAASVATETGSGGPSAFLAALAAALHARLRDVSRLTGPAHAPEATLRAGQGSCRDFAVLFVSCCRHQGLAARFVSGYLPAPPGEPQHMHAWAEVLLPGLGWVAYDPTRGGLAGPEHIPVAAAAESFGAAPLEGAFTPQDGPARSEMTVDVVVETEAS